jgi:hypothetical protein
MPPKSGQACGVPCAPSFGQETSDKSRKHKPSGIDNSISTLKKKKKADSGTTISIQERVCIEYASDSELLCVSCSEFKDPLKSPSSSILCERCRFIGFWRLEEMEEAEWIASFDETGMLQGENNQFEYFTWKPA